MTKSITLMVYPVSDLQRSKDLYTKLLGVEPYIDSPYYVGYKVGEVEIGLDPNGLIEDGALNYLDVDDINKSITDYRAAGAELLSEPKDVGAGLLVAKIKDIDGNILGLRQFAKDE